MDINGSACNYTDNAACKDVSCNAPISPSHQATGRQVLQFLNDAKNNVTFLESCSSKVQQLLNNLPCYDEKTTGELVDWFQVIDVLRELYSREVRRTHPMVEYYVLLLEEQLLQHSLEAEQIQWRIAERKSVFFHVLDQVIFKACCLALSLRENNVGLPTDGTGAPSSSATNLLRVLQDL